MLYFALGLFAIGAYRHLAAGPPAMEELLRPTSVVGLNRAAGIAEIIPGPDLSKHCEWGRVTVFAFYSNTCSGCRRLLHDISRFAELRPDVAFRLIDLGADWHSRDCRQLYGIELRSIPHVVIYSSGGKRIAADQGLDKQGLELLYGWMNTELQNKER